jgi:hypothetical protein
METLDDWLVSIAMHACPISQVTFHKMDISEKETVSWTLAKLPLLMFQRFIVKDNVRSIGVK